MTSLVSRLRGPRIANLEAFARLWIPLSSALSRFGPAARPHTAWWRSVPSARSWRWRRCADPGPGVCGARDSITRSIVECSASGSARYFRLMSLFCGAFRVSTRATHGRVHPLADLVSPTIRSALDSGLHGGRALALARSDLRRRSSDRPELSASQVPTLFVFRAGVCCHAGNLIGWYCQPVSIASRVGLYLGVVAAMSLVSRLYQSATQRAPHRYEAPCCQRGPTDEPSAPAADPDRGCGPGGARGSRRSVLPSPTRRP